MKILVFTHYYPPEVGAAANRVASFVASWQRRGASVQVITPLPHYPSGDWDRSVSASSLFRPKTGPFGEDVIRIPFLPGATEGARKFGDHLLAAAAGLPFALKSADLAFATIPSLPMIAPTLAAAQLRNVPLVLDFRDAWPDLISDSEASGNAAVERALTALVTKGQASADAILTATDGFADVLAARFPSVRVEPIANGIHLDAVPLLPPPAVAGGTLRVLYLGTHGISQDLEVSVRALAQVGGDRVKARFIGDGTAKPGLVGLAKELDAPLTFEEPIVGDALWDAYRWSHVCLVPLRDWPSFDHTVPSKLYEIQAAGRLVLGAVRGEAASVLEDAGGGFVVEPGSVDALAGGLRTLIANPSLLDVGEKPRRWVAENADRDRLADQAYDILQSVVAEHNRGPQRPGLVARNRRRVRMLRNVGAGAVATRVQRAGRSRLSQLTGVDRALVRPVPAVQGWPSDLPQIFDVTHTDADSTEIGNGVFSFRGERSEFDLGGPWRSANASALWHFDLHSFGWLWRFGVDGDRADRTLAERLLRSWHREHGSPERGSVWHPYPASLRAWEWCRAYDTVFADSTWRADLTESLWDHHRAIASNLETDLGGNHLIKNLKALIGLEVFFGLDVSAEGHLDQLLEQLKIQIADDGGHRERATAYHVDVLVDLVEIVAVMEGSDLTVPGKLHDAIASMQQFLSGITLGNNYVPTIGDGWPIPAETIRSLRMLLGGGSETTGSDSTVVLPDAGLVVVRRGATELLADVGTTCWNRLPSHGHGSALSFVLVDRGEPIIVDPPSTTYQPGPVRDLERSAHAHNTVLVDGVDQGEFWGAFRVGRIPSSHLVRVTEQDDGTADIVARNSLYGPRRNPIGHSRTWQVSEGNVQIVDHLQTSGARQAKLTFCIGLSSSNLVVSETQVIVGPWLLTLDSASLLDVSTDDQRASGGINLTALYETGTVPNLRIVTVLTRA